MSIQLAILLNLFVRSYFLLPFYTFACVTILLLFAYHKSKLLLTLLYMNQRSHRYHYFPDIFEMNLFLQDYNIFLRELSRQLQANALNNRNSTLKPKT